MAQQGHVDEGMIITPSYLQSVERDITQVEADIAALMRQPVTSRQRAYALVGAESILRQLENTRYDYRHLMRLSQTEPEEEPPCNGTL